MLKSLFAWHQIGSDASAPAQAQPMRTWSLGLLLVLSLSNAQSQNMPNMQEATSRMSSSAFVAPQGRAATRQASAPGPKQYEDQLNAIRQAILEATIDRPTRVLSSAWIDEKGALRESAHFHSEANVRGVRVLSYLQDGQEPQTQVSAEVLPWGWRAQAAKGASCSPPPRPWRLPLILQTRAEPGFTGPQSFASQSLLKSVQQVWAQKMQDSQRWRPQFKELPQDNAYMRALTDPNDGAIGWAAELVLKPHAAALQATPSWSDRLFHTPKPEADWRWTLTLTVGERLSPNAMIEPQWQLEQVVNIDPQAVGKSPSAWSQQLKEQLQTQMHAWVQQLDKRSECEPVQFHVQRQGSNLLQLHAGIGSGLRQGDRVLLMNPSHVPSRMLEAGAAQHLALAQVVKVGTNRTELQQLAGPALAAHGHWMALPL